MNNYLDPAYSGPLSLDTDMLLQFCDRLSDELINQGIVPNISYTRRNNGKVITGGVLNYLIDPVNFLTEWAKEYANGEYINGKRFFEDHLDNEKYIIKSDVDKICLKKTSTISGGYKYLVRRDDSVAKNFFCNLKIGDSFKNSLIAPALNLIYTYRCTEGHEGQSDPENIALKTVYASILLLSERLSIIFERIDELERLAVDVEETKQKDNVSDDLTSISQKDIDKLNDNFS